MRESALAHPGVWRLLLTVGVVAYVGVSFTLPLRMADGTPGPGMLPRLVGLLLVVALLPDLVSRRGRPNGDAVAGREPPVRTALLVVGFAVLLPLAGAELTTAAFAFAMRRSDASVGGFRAVSYAVLVAVALSLVFRVGLGVPLPAGLLSRIG